MALFLKSRSTLGVGWAANVYWFLLSVCTLVVISWLGWQGMRLQQFHFDFLYDAMAIADHIAQYAPQNRHFLGFEQLSKAQHVELFNGIAIAIEQHGQGLADLSFRSTYGVQPLLTQAEIVHLIDVARLITFFNYSAIYASLLAVCLIAFVILTRRAHPLSQRFPPLSRRGLLSVYVGLVSILILSLLLLGPTTVFYWLHDVVFPAQHQWFFYYQDSLMTTLMKAPDLFGMISIGLLGYMIVISIVGHYGIRWLQSVCKDV